MVLPAKKKINTPGCPEDATQGGDVDVEMWHFNWRPKMDGCFFSNEFKQLFQVCRYFRYWRLKKTEKNPAVLGLCILCWGTSQARWRRKLRNQTEPVWQPYWYFKIWDTGILKKCVKICQELLRIEILRSFFFPYLTSFDMNESWLMHPKHKKKDGFFRLDSNLELWCYDQKIPMIDWWSLKGNKKHQKSTQIRVTSDDLNHKWWFSKIETGFW